MIDRNGDDIVKIVPILHSAPSQLQAPLGSNNEAICSAGLHFRSICEDKKLGEEKKEERNCADPHFAKKILFWATCPSLCSSFSRQNFFLAKNGKFFFKCCRYLSGLVGIRTPPERPKKMLFGFVWICRNWSGLVRICRWRCILHGWR